MIYLDTSVVIAMLTPEERSPLALDWFEQCREPLISSDWLITETHQRSGHQAASAWPQAAGPPGCGRAVRATAAERR